MAPPITTSRATTKITTRKVTLLGAGALGAFRETVVVGAAGTTFVGPVTAGPGTTITVSGLFALARTSITTTVMLSLPPLRLATATSSLAASTGLENRD